jgi:hypothetical protein
MVKDRRAGFGVPFHAAPDGLGDKLILISTSILRNFRIPLTKSNKLTLPLQPLLHTQIQ